MERRAVKFRARVLCGFLAAVCLAAAPGARALQTRAASSLATEAEDKNLRTRADRAFQSQKNSEALELYLQAYPAYQEDFEVNRRIGRLYFISRKKGEWRKALPYLRKAHASRPGDMEVLHSLALVTAWWRKFEESFLLFRKLLGSAPEVKAYRLEFARALRWAGEISESAKYYGYYLDQSPSDLKVRVELAKMLAERREFAGAIDQYQYVLRFQPENDVARLGLAKLWRGPETTRPVRSRWNESCRASRRITMRAWSER